MATGASAQPANDEWDAATVVGEPLPFTDHLSTLDATRAFSDPPCFAEERSVWYAFATTEDVQLDANTYGSDYDTTLSAYLGEPSISTQIACNDDTLSFQSQIRVDVPAGSTVYFMIGSYTNEPGPNLVFTVDRPPPPVDIELVVEPEGEASLVTGVAWIRGRVKCSYATPVNVFGELAQKVDPLHVFRADFFAPLSQCLGWTTWNTQVAASGPFNPGLAGVDARAVYFDPDINGFARVEISEIVELEGVIVPEPTPSALGLAALATLAVLRQRRRFTRWE
jgi:MYXO-CTERM domain-containing protein